jgi:hypothetical protein
MTTSLERSIGGRIESGTTKHVTSTSCKIVMCIMYSCSLDSNAAIFSPRIQLIL